MISRLACPWFHSLDWQKTFLGTSNIMLWCKDCGLKEPPSIPSYWITSSGYSYHDSNELSHPRSRQKRSSTSITNKSIHISGLTRQNGRDRSIPTLYPTTPLDSDDTYNNKKRKGRKNKLAGCVAHALVAVRQMVYTRMKSIKTPPEEKQHSRSNRRRRKQDKPNPQPFVTASQIQNPPPSSHHDKFRSPH